MHSWFRKKHPKTLEYVPPPPLGASKDPLRNMTVLPYLGDLHRPGTPSDLSGEEDGELLEGDHHPYIPHQGNFIDQKFRKLM